MKDPMANAAADVPVRGLLNLVAGLLVQLAILPAAPAVSAVVIDFEDLVAGAPGGAGGSPADVRTRYSAQGVSFQNALGFDYSRGAIPPVPPDFAHSGTKAVEPCYAIEFCTSPLHMDFTTPQRRVRVWVGFSQSLSPQQPVVLRVFDAAGVQLGESIATLGPSTGTSPIPIRMPLEVAVADARIARATVGFLVVELPNPPLFNNDLAIDDVEFQAEIGPDTANGTVVRFGAETAGQPIGLAGSESSLYLATLNAGVWKSIANGPWAQLSNSPARAYSIAVDPSDASHVVAGERDGDAVDARVNGAGLWESHDAGNTWNYSFNPLSLAGCSSQSIPSLAFSQSGTLFIAGPCGIGRRQAGQPRFDFSRTPPGLGLVTAVVGSETKVWARTASKLLVSADDGSNWRVIEIPSSLEGLAITFPSRGDTFSLAAFDSGAFMPSSFDPTPPCGNLNRLLTYNALTDDWAVDPRFDSSGKPALGCDGTGCGGRRFAKSFILERPDLQAIIGQRLQLFIGVGQEIYQADGVDSDGRITAWTRVALASGACTGGFFDPIHPDLWDFHLSPDASRAWLADDGGVHSKSWQLGGWATFNQNLSTHYIHTLIVLQTGSPGDPRFAYATPDNDAWFYDHLTGQWQTLNGLGDANWTAGDAGNPKIALMWRRPGVAVLTGFSEPLPAGQTYQYGIVLNNDETFDGPLFLQFIQTLENESPTYPLLDAVMLANLPLKYRDSTGDLIPVPGALGQPDPRGRPVLIRNREFAASPDANASRFQTWQIEATDLPMETRGFWVSGGHANPTYFAYTRQADGTTSLYKRDPQKGAGWSLLNVSGLLDGSTYGPAFINPYNPDRIFVLTASGIQVSANGSAFSIDPVLTALLTDSGKFPLTGTFGGGSANNVIIGSRANTMGTLSQMAFGRANPNAMVAASPFTGVFYSSGDGVWSDLTGALARPFTAVSTVGIDDQAIYVGTEGRGLQRIALRVATSASIITEVRQFSSAGKLTQGEARSLVRILDAAARARAVGNCGAAVRLYQAFINQLKAQSGKKVEASAATTLIQDAQYLIAHCP